MVIIKGKKVFQVFYVLHMRNLHAKNSYSSMITTEEIKLFFSEVKCPSRHNRQTNTLGIDDPCLEE